MMFCRRIIQVTLMTMSFIVFLVIINITSFRENGGMFKCFLNSVHVFPRMTTYGLLKKKTKKCLTLFM